MELPVGFDLKSIQGFIIVAETGSMTRASERLKITQSGVSQLINNLEESVGTELFDRSVRPIALTPAGAALYEKGREILAVANDAYRKTLDQSNTTYPTLTLAMAESLANTVGPVLVKELKPLAKRWRIWSGISPDHHTALLNRSVDLIITVSEELDAHEGLDYYPLITEPFVLVFPLNYQKPVDDLSLIGDIPFIRYSLRSAIGRQIEAQLHRLRLDLPIQMEFDTATSQIAAVADGMGWSITTPICLIQEHSQLHRLRVAPMKRGRFSRTIKLVSKTGDLEGIAITIAATCRRILAEQCLPILLSKHPWISEYIHWHNDRY